MHAHFMHLPLFSCMGDFMRAANFSKPWLFAAQDGLRFNAHGICVK